MSLREASLNGKGKKNRESDSYFNRFIYINRRLNFREAGFNWERETRTHFYEKFQKRISFIFQQEITGLYI